MKKLKISKIFFMIALLFFTLACEEDFYDINDDPNNPLEATVDLVFPAGVSSTAYVLGGWYQILGGLWAQHWTQSVGAQQYREYDQYNINSNTMDGWQYSELYAGALNDLEYVRKTAKNNEDWSFYLMATTMQCYTFHILLDLYESIPFSDALKGNEGLFTPKFDDGQDIYDALIGRLDEALSHDYSTFKSSANPDASATDPGNQDIVFGGDMMQWEQFANTLKLKLFLRQANSTARPAVAQAGVEGLYTDNASFLATDATMTQFTAEVDRRNPVYETEWSRFGGVNIVASNTLLNFLQDNDDPRVDGIYNTPDNGGSHSGLDQGDFFNPGPTSAADNSQPNVTGLDPVYFMSAAESYFLQAEAAARWGTGDAKSLYEAGVQAAFAKYSMTPDSLIASGGAYEFPSGGTMEDQIEAIIVQKWVSMANSQGLEAFFEQNRTGYPDFFTLSVNASTNDFPRRLLYPESEYSTNPNNVPELKRVYEKMWWHKQ